MGVISNRITAGDYKDADIKLKGFGKQVVLVKTGLFKDTKIILNKDTVDHIELIDKSQSMFDFIGAQTAQVKIYFKDGKKSLASMQTDIYQQLNEILF